MAVSSIDPMLEFFDRVSHFLDIFHRPPYRILGPSGDFEYLYREDDHRVTIVFEYTLGAREGDVQVYGSSTVRWLPPHEDELIPEEKRQQIIERLGKELEKGKATYWVVSEPEFEKRERQEALKAKAAKAGKSR